MKRSGIRQSHKLGLVNIYSHAKTFQNIPGGLKVICPLSVSEKFCLSEANYEEIRH